MAREGDRERVTPPYRVACVPFLVLQSVGNLQQSVWLCGVGGLAGQAALSFHCACWHQAEPRSLGQKPGPAQSISLMGSPEGSPVK